VNVAVTTNVKHLLFRFYPGLALIAVAAGLALIFTFETDGQVGLSGALIASILGFCYFVQQQKLAETHLLKDLFTEFNARYDALNNDLLRIKSSTTLSQDDKCTVIDYLNLCAEEYLFFRLGYILPDVWKAWCRGMRDYLSAPSIAELWREEFKTDSYYGLSEEVIRKDTA